MHSSHVPRSLSLRPSASSLTDISRAAFRACGRDAHQSSLPLRDEDRKARATPSRVFLIRAARSPCSHDRRKSRARLSAEGEGFEPSDDLTAASGFRDRAEPAAVPYPNWSQRPAFVRLICSGATALLARESETLIGFRRDFRCSSLARARAGPAKRPGCLGSGHARGRPASDDGGVAPAETTDALLSAAGSRAV